MKSKYILIIVILFTITIVSGCSKQIPIYSTNNQQVIVNPAYAFAYTLNNDDVGYPTEIVDANTYYAINGTFINNPIRNFGLTSQPSIIYMGSQTKYFKIDYFVSLSDNSASTTVHIGIKKNNEVLNESIMVNYLKNINEIYFIAGTVVTQLNYNDTIQLVVSTDNGGNTISVKHFTTTIEEFK